VKGRVSSKGQITIPGALRKHLGLRAGSTVEFVQEPGRIVLRKVLDDDPFRDLFGSLGHEKRTDQWLEELRGPRIHH
jgi:AbrB family looped-hinge helix DNA binding protein